MKITIVSGFIFFVLSSFSTAAILDDFTDDFFKSPPRPNLSSDNRFLLGEEQVKPLDYASLSIKEKYAVMQTSIQNGYLYSALVIAEELQKTQANDITIKALIAAKAVYNGKYKDAEALLNTLKGGNKYESATIELVWALYFNATAQVQNALKSVNAVLSLRPKHPYAFALKGVILYSENKIPEARNSFLQSISLYNKMAIAHVNLAYLELEANNFSLASTHFQTAIDIHPKNCNALYGQAIALAQLNQTSAAWQAIKPCTQNNTQLSNRRFGAQLLRDMGDNATAWELITTTKGFSDDPASLTLAANIALRQGNIDKALQYSKGKSHQAIYQQGIALLAAEHFTQAIYIFEQIHNPEEPYPSVDLANQVAHFLAHKPGAAKSLDALTQHPQLAPIAHFIQAHLWINTDKAAAVQVLSKASGISQGINFSALKHSSAIAQLENATAPYLVAGVFFDLLGASAIAENNFRKALSSKDFLAHYFLGQILFKQGKVAQAQTLFQQSIDTTPEFFASNQALGDSYMKLGDLEKASLYFDKALAVEEAPGAYLKAGALAERLNHLEKAESYFERLVELTPNNPIGFNQLAWFYASHDLKLDTGIELGVQAVELSKGDPNTMDTLGWLYFKTKNYEQALHWLDKANKASTNRNPSVLYHLGNTQYALGESQQALKTLEQALLSKNFKYKEQTTHLIQQIKISPH
ncbi:tetratricopeptide repeat protein [Teredinibacter haidensis]|uniref:tetratricopeptide repeat protein n=1 Tax=Teredinibacter haidensis TaxID=2731755 RepID=UPI000948F2B9|nr:tetratricopeptide repeat protein [Teredinibacter haidensis]